MRHSRSLLALATVLLGCAAVHAEGEPSTAKLAKAIDAVTLPAADGTSWSLASLRGKEAVVAVFLSFECPVSNNYTSLLADMARTYASRGVAFVGFCANDDLDAAAVARQARDYQLPFPVFADPRHVAADAFKADVTPEAFVLDRHGILRYRGRIDDGYAARLKKNLHITRHDLRQALDEVLAGKPVSTPATAAIGCPLTRDRVLRKEGAVTYHRDVLPILQANCQTCHRPGAVGPFALMSYRQAVTWASDIKEYTQSRQMPPWKPTEGLPFHNERKLSDREIATLAAWVDGGTPEGDPKDAPAPVRFTDGWQLGEPDLVLTTNADFQVGPSGKDLFRCFVLPTNLTEDRYVTAVEVRPSNPRVVHHALLFIDTTGQGRKLEEKEQARSLADTDLDRGPGYSVAMGAGFLPQGGLSGWAPGTMARHLPEGTGYFLPRGSDVVMQVHYHRNGRVERDRTSIGLYFARKPVQTRFQSLVLPGGGRLSMLLTIPAGKADHRVQGTIWVDQDCTLHTVMPHMHMVGKRIKVTMTPPDGLPQTLVAIDAWDYNWQETYLLREPLRVKAGTRFDVEAIYDNSAANPSNPNSPPRLVRFGQQTTDEMCFVFLGATADTPGRIRPRFEPLKADVKQP